MRICIWAGLCLGFVFRAAVMAEDWPGWRGPRGDGTSAETNVPVVWNASSNILWKTELPGGGHASPIVSNQRIFTAAADLQTRDRFLVCLDLHGRLRWKQAVVQAPLERKHTLNSYASSTPAADGHTVYTAFLDQNEMVVAAYDFEGKEKWKVRPGPFNSMHGFCSSPVLFEDKVIVNGDHDGDSYIAALSREDGRTLWKTPRANRTRSYCVPLIRQIKDRLQMVMSGDMTVASYDPRTGAQHWIMDGPTEQFVASIVYNPKHDLLFVTGGYPELHILGVDPHGAGNVTKTHIKWRGNKGVSYVPSPVSVGDWFFLVSDAGIGSCFEAATGTILWQERMAGEHHASLVTANGLVYFLSDAGVTTVVKAQPTFEVVSKNELGERCFASPAISNGRIYIRSDRQIFCIGR